MTTEHVSSPVLTEEAPLPRWMWPAVGGLVVFLIMVGLTATFLIVKAVKNKRAVEQPEQVVETATGQPASPAAPAPAVEPKSEPEPAIEVPVDPQVHVDEMNARALKKLRPYYAAAKLFESIDTTGWPQLPREVGPNIVTVMLREFDRDGAVVAGEQEVPIYLQNWSNVFAAYVAAGMPVEVPTQLGLLPECPELPAIMAHATADPNVVFQVVTAIRNADPEVVTAIGLDSLESGTVLASHWRAAGADFRDLEFKLGVLQQEDKTVSEIKTSLGEMELTYLNRYVDAGRGHSGADQIARYKWAIATLSTRFDKTKSEARVKRAHYELRLVDQAFPHRDEMLQALEADWNALHPQS